MPTEKPRYTITLDEEMLKRIDDFRFENRFPNRTQATLELTVLENFPLFCPKCKQETIINVTGQNVVVINPLKN